MFNLIKPPSIDNPVSRHHLETTHGVDNQCIGVSHEASTSPLIRTHDLVLSHNSLISLHWICCFYYFKKCNPRRTSLYSISTLTQVLIRCYAMALAGLPKYIYSLNVFQKEIKSSIDDVFYLLAQFHWLSFVGIKITYYSCCSRETLLTMGILFFRKIRGSQGMTRLKEQGCNFFFPFCNQWPLRSSCRTL